MSDYQPSPFTLLMGVKILRRAADRSESELTVREDLCNRRGVIHGGAVMAWGDTMGGMTASAGTPRATTEDRAGRPRSLLCADVFSCGLLQTQRERPPGQLAPMSNS